MSRYILNDPDVLINFINNYDNSRKYLFSLKIKSISYTNILESITILPLTLIEIINAYTHQEFEFEVYNIRTFYHNNINHNSLGLSSLKRYYHAHFMFYTKYVPYFRFIYCTKCRSFTNQDPIYRTTLRYCYFDCDVIQQKIFVNNFNDALVRSMTIHSVLEKPDKYFGCVMANGYLDGVWKHYLNGDGMYGDSNDSNDFNSLIDCYNKNTYQRNKQQTQYSTFERIVVRTGNIDEYKYCEKTKSYNHILSTCETTKITNYKIVDHDKFENIITINNLFYEIVNEHMKKTLILQNIIKN